MKRRVALLPLTALLSLLLSSAVLADVIERPPVLCEGVAGIPPFAIIILVAALALSTVLIIRRFKKPGKSHELSRSGAKNEHNAPDMKNPPNR